MITRCPHHDRRKAPAVLKLLLVVNGAAGTADDDSVEVVLRVLRAGADVVVATTEDGDDLAEVVAGRGDRRLVVLGGDGSVHAAVSALDRAGALDPADPVGVIARGTGNDLARALGLPLDPAEGAAAVLSGRPRPVDLLRGDDGELVVNAVHVGLGAQASAEAVRFKDALGPAAYPLGAVIAGVTGAGTRLRVEVDGAVVGSEEGGWAADGSTEVLMVGVCNGPTVAGGTALAPGAQVDDGLADVMVCTATGPVARAAFAAALLAGTHVERDDVVVVRGSRVRVTGEPTESVPDGELRPAAAALGWRVEPAAWSVLVPG
jgi:diacylglycerol kinase family enzyme